MQLATLQILFFLRPFAVGVPYGSVTIRSALALAFAFGIQIFKAQKILS
jgi:hypothetical protein